LFLIDGSSAVGCTCPLESIARLTSVFEIHGTEDEAVASFA